MPMGQPASISLLGGKFFVSSQKPLKTGHSFPQVQLISTCLHPLFGCLSLGGAVDYIIGHPLLTSGYM